MSAKDYPLWAGLRKPEAIISQRQAAIWNLRQLGLIAPFATAREAVSSVVAVQAQDSAAAARAVALRTAENFELQATLPPESGLVRMWTVRGTMHLVLAEEAAYHQAATVEDWFSRWGRFLDKYLPIPREQVKHELYPRIAALLTDKPQNHEEIAVAAQLTEPYVKVLPHLMKDLCYLGLCVRGFRDGHRALYMRASYPKVAGLDTQAAQRWLVRRFIERYGPVTLADMVYWSGLRVPVVKELVQQLEAELVLVTIEGQDNPAFLLAEQLSALLGHPQDVNLPERYLSAYDVLLLGYKDKTRFLKDEYRRKVFLSAARVAPTILSDGRIGGTWRTGKTGIEADWFAP